MSVKKIRRSRYSEMQRVSRHIHSGKIKAVCVIQDNTTKKVLDVCSDRQAAVRLVAEKFDDVGVEFLDFVLER